MLTTQSFTLDIIEGYSIPLRLETGLQQVSDKLILILLLEGEGCCTIFTKDFGLNREKVLMIAPGHQHAFVFNTSAKGYRLDIHPSYLYRDLPDERMVLNGSIFSDFFSKQPELYPTGNTLTGLREVFNKMLYEYNNDLVLRSEMLDHYMQLILTYIRREIDHSVLACCIDRGSFVLKNFLQLLEANYLKRKSVCFYASELCLSASYFNVLIKKTSGASASYHITQRMLREIRRCIKQDAASLKQIACRLGYNDLAHFSKFVKKTTGMNFTHYRKKLSIEVVKADFSDKSYNYLNNLSVAHTSA